MTTLLTIPEVAKFLKVNDRTILRLISGQKIEAAKIGKQWRLKQEAIDEYIESRTIKAKKPKASVL